jgi:quinol monooxygenase YgiN
MSENVVVVATIEAKEGNEDRVEQALRTAVRAVHGEPGCLKYALHRDPRNPAKFVMIENWESADALRTHGKAAPLAELGAALDGLLAGQLDVQTFTALPDGDENLGKL